MSAPPDGATKQSDVLLWLAGAVVVGIGLFWLVLSKPWSGGADEMRSVEPASAAAAPTPAPAPQRGSQNAMGASLEDDPLRMARLAHEAGMLTEPEDYSAWALYRKALQREPDSAAARQGLEKIAAELIRRADVALEQGRFDDVRATVERIRAAIPVHTGANDLAIRLNELAPRSQDERFADTDPTDADSTDGAQAPQETAAEQASTPAAAPRPAPEPRVDPMLAPHEAFAAALEQNRLLTPESESARHFVDVLSGLDPEHELTHDATSRLFNALVARAEQALDTEDTDAATTWIEEAEQLAGDGTATADVRSRLRAQLIDIESSRRLPASALTVVSYTPPIYPARALERQLHGWVDIEFTVARDGTTRDVVVTDASHNSYFRDEAIRAVAAWRFEPHIFLDEPIEQRSYTRIRFEFHQ
jgi:TonB family protein